MWNMLKVKIMIPEQRQWCRSGIFIVNFEHLSHLVLVLHRSRDLFPCVIFHTLLFIATILVNRYHDEKQSSFKKPQIFRQAQKYCVLPVIEYIMYIWFVSNFYCNRNSRLVTKISNSKCKMHIFDKNQKKINQTVFLIFLSVLFLFSPVSLNKILYPNIKSD